MIDEYVGVEPPPTEKQRKWREVTRLFLNRLPLFFCSIDFFIILQSDYFLNFFRIVAIVGVSH